MPAALLTTFFFALSAIFARRSTVYVGTQPANLGRQVIALVLLGLWAHTAGEGLRGATFGVFFVSGMIGFGFGDWALFEAYPRLGSALTVLICQCLAAPIGAVTERLWLGTAMTSHQIIASAVTLLGVALAMAPERNSVIPQGHRFAGVLYALVAATGQGWGAVLSRYAFQRADHAGFHLDGITAAYQRLWGGITSILFILFVTHLVGRWRGRPVAAAPLDWRGGTPWILANAVVGPTVGVSCYLWALHVAPSSIVLPIVATTPLVVMVMAFIFEQVQPSRRTLIGSAVAVAGVVALVRSA